MNEKTTQKNLINKEALLRIGEDNSVQTTGVLGAVQRGAVKRASVINRIDLGIEQRRSRGLIQETGISLAKGAYNVGSGLVRTAAFLADPTGEMGHGEIRRGIDRFESTRGGFVRGAKDKSLPTTVVSGIAEQLPNILMSMAGVGAGMSIARAAEVGALGKVAAVKAGQVASLGIWRYGAIRDDLHKASNGRLSDASINWTAFMATSLEAGLETMFGPEQVIAKMSIMKALGKATGKTGMARAIATGTFGEFSTEAIQSISESLFQDFAAEGLGGLDLTIDDVKQAITEGVMAIPTAMLFGGVQSFAEYRVESGALDRQRGIDADKKMVLGKYTTPKEKADAETRIEKAFLDFGAKLSAKFGDEGGKALVFAMREHAYHWAAQNNTDPDLSIAEFEVMFSDTELSQTQIEEIRAITDPTQHAAWMRENVQGYREFDAGKTEKYLIDATEQQIQFELKKLRRIFGDDFRSDIIDTEAQTQEDAEDNAQADAAEAGRAPKPSDAVNDIRAQRIESIKRLRKLRQDAALRVKEIPITDRQAHLDYTTITKAAASDMYRALTDPDADASWIDPAAMRENLAGMIYLNNPGMTREAAYDIAQSLGDEQMAGMDGTELRAAFMLEAASSEIEGHYDIDELTDSIRVLSRNDKAWASFVSGQRSQAMHEAMLQAAERADIDRIRLAELVLSHANEVSREASSGLVVRETTDRDNTGTEQMLDRIAENSGKLRAMIYEGGDAVAMAEVVGLIENDVAELSDLVEQVKIDVLKRDIGFDPGKDAAQDLDGFGPDAVPVADEAAEQPSHIQAEAERLFESAFKKEVFAHYDFAKRRATFYKNATAEDVLHEWFHHVEMNGLLPPEMKAAMDKHYGINKDSSETDKRLAREKSARDFVAYVKTTSEGGIAGIETDQPEEMRRAFDYLRAVFAETYKADKGFSMPGGQQESSHIDMPGGMEAEISEWGKKKGLTDSAIGDLIRKSTESWFGGDVASLKERFKGNAILEARAEGAEQNSAKNVDIRSKTQMDLDLRESSTDGVIEYKPEVREFFEGAFDNVTAEAHQKAIAEILIESGQERPPVADTEANRMYESGDVITLTDKTKLRQRAFSFTPNGWDKLEWFRNSISEVAGVEYVKGESRSDLWNGFSIPQMQQVAQKTMDAHEAAGITGKAYFSKSQLDTAATHVNPNAKTFNDLGPDERKQAISLLGSIARATVAKLTKKLKTTEARKKAISTGLSLFNAGINAME
ncbi:MAG: hypothetical protein KAG97_11595, partial [Victivallales bacterium]|nr:hypothetical protein [Victivallales bacterium]